MIKNKKTRFIISLILAGIVFYIRYQENPQKPTLEDKTNTTAQNGDFNYLPTSTTGQVVKHNGYTLSYSEPHEQAEWVAYSLDRKDIVYTNFKRPFFIADPKVKTTSANWRSYKRSGYDRGHLCPAGDRKQSKQLYNETFYTSNISPQNHEFNTGIWNNLEQKVRYWAQKYKHLYVVTGGILTKNLKTIGKDKVAIPKEYYKIVLDYTQPEIKAIAFLMPNKNSNKPLYEFVVTIDEIEQKTGIDFFPNLPNNIEKKLEASSNYKNWSFR